MLPSFSIVNSVHFCYFSFKLFVAEIQKQSLYINCILNILVLKACSFSLGFLCRRSHYLQITSVLFFVFYIEIIDIFPCVVVLDRFSNIIPNKSMLAGILYLFLAFRQISISKVSPFIVLICFPKVCFYQVKDINFLKDYFSRVVLN